MKPIMQWKKALLVFMAVALLAAALPSVAMAQSDLVRFTVENRSDRDITIRLYSRDGSGRAYYMQVLAETTKIMTPLKGIYDYRLTACGVMVWGEVDLNGPLTWLMQDCGDKGGPGSKAPNTQDIGKILALTKVELINNTGTTLRVRFDGPFQYVFDIPVGGTKLVSILKGFYHWTHFACGGQLREGNLYAAGAKIKSFICTY
jgi:hypothetical protein